MTWTTITLSDLATVSSGGGAPQDPNAFSAEGIPFVRAGSLIKLLEGLPEDELELLQPDVASAHKLKLFPAGTVLFAKSGMSATKGHIYQLKRPAYVVNHLAALTPRSKSAGDYLRHVLRFKSPTCLIKDEAYPSIRLGEVENMELPAPKADADRERIAAILDQADELRRKRQRALDRLNQLGQSIFHEMFGDPVANDRGWPIERLDDASRNITDGTHDTPVRTPSGIPFITSKNVRPFEFDLSNLEYVSLEAHKEIIKRCNPQQGDILYTNIGASVGSAVQNRFEFEFSLKNVALIQPNQQRMRSDYLEYMLNNSGFKNAMLSASAAGGAQKFVTLKALRNARVPLPPLEQQESFAERVATLSVAKLNMVKQQDEFASLFASLQHRAFRGEL